MILTYQSQFRTESDQTAISNLIRKGWTEAKLDVTAAQDVDDQRIASGLPAAWPINSRLLKQGEAAIYTEMTQEEELQLRVSLQAAFEAWQNRPIVPETVSPRQLQRALVLAGISIVNIEAAIEAIPDETQKLLARIDWGKATEYKRSDPTLIALATALGKSTEEINALFILAATQ